MNKRTLAWVLILAPALYIAYHAFLNGAFSGNQNHLYVFLAVVVWLIGDYMLSKN